MLDLRLRYLFWKLRLKDRLLRRYWPHTYNAVHRPVWIHGPFAVYHDWGGGYLILHDRDGDHVSFDEFGHVVEYVLGQRGAA